MEKSLYLGKMFTIQPNYIYAKSVWEGSTSCRSLAQLETKKNLNNNSHNGNLSEQTIKKMRKAINWLAAAAKPQHVYDAAQQKSFYFKTNFITLTIPAEGNQMSPADFSKTLLNPFLSYARKFFALANYVWKLEMSGNGLVHVHITSDTFINYARLRRAWNKILSSKGLIDGYTAKHKQLSLEKYLLLYPAKNNDELQKRKQAYNYGVATNWSNPNSTDVHACKGVRNLASYLCGYLSKAKQKYIKVRGRYKAIKIRGRVRLWGCSYSLSSANKCQVHLFPPDIGSNTRGLYSHAIAYNPIYGKLNSAGIPSLLGELFFIKPEQWAATIKGELYAKFRDHINRIRTKVSDLFNTDADKLQGLPPTLEGRDTSAHISTCKTQVRNMRHTQQSLLHLPEFA